MHAILQVLSLSLFEVRPLNERLGTVAQTDDIEPSTLPSCLFPEISGQIVNLTPIILQRCIDEFRVAEYDKR